MLNLDGLGVLVLVGLLILACGAVIVMALLRTGDK